MCTGTLWEGLILCVFESFTLSKTVWKRKATFAKEGTDRELGVKCSLEPPAFLAPWELRFDERPIMEHRLGKQYVSELIF